MLTKSDLENVLQETKALKTRTEAAESKVKALEDEKTSWLANGGGGGQGPVGNRSGSDEARAMRYFGVSHPKHLLAINVAADRFRAVPEELKHVVLQFKKTVDTSRWISQMFYGEAMDRIGKKETEDTVSRVKGILTNPYGRDVLVPYLKAFGSTVASAGDEWVPTAISTSYIPEYELEKVIEKRVRQVNMPSNPFDMPVLKNVTKARKASEGVAMTGSNFGTDKISLSATKLAEYYELPEELSEDSAPDFLAAARDEVIMAQARAAESAIINGDDDGTHIDSDTQALAADVAEKIWKGWRRQALANSANGSTLDFAGVITEALLSTLRARMGKFGSNPKELLWVLGPVGYTQMLALPSVKTLDVFGPQAVVLQGALAAYQGIPIVNSGHFREDLNATGVYDGVTTTKAAVILVNATRWYLGQRRPIQIKLMNDLPSGDRWLLASYRRVDFKGHVQSATEKSVVYGYNVTT